MLTYFAKRVGASPLFLIGITLVTFALSFLFPVRNGLVEPSEQILLLKITTKTYSTKDSTNSEIRLASAVVKSLGSSMDTSTIARKGNLYDLMSPKLLFCRSFDRLATELLLCA